MKRGLSISLRLTLWFSAIFLCGFAGFGGVMWFDLEHSLLQGRDKTLGNRARRLVEMLEVPGGEDARRRAHRYQEFVEATPEGRLVEVFRPDGSRLFPPAGEPGSGFPWPSTVAADGERRATILFHDRDYRVLMRRATVGGMPAWIFVAGQLEDNRVMLQRFTEGLLRALPLLLVAAALAGYFVSRRALDPVARLIESGRSITIGNLSRRLPVSQTGDELARLAETWNGMLARLEASVSRITRFTADASHELRSPLSFIRVASESMLRQPGLDAEVAEVFREIVAEAEAATRLLDDMLVLARSDAGHIEVAFDPVELGESVVEVAGKARVLAAGKQQRLEVRDDGGGLCVAGDAALLRRLAWILIDNAIKYTPHGGRIDVAVSRAGPRLVLEVSDSGCGIPADALPHIFERFFRVDPARNGEEGTGLGLAIAKWIVDTHAAEVSVTSTERVGTTFRVCFSPLAAGG